jgi:hypothetical protein
MSRKTKIHSLLIEAVLEIHGFVKDIENSYTELPQ